MTRAHRPTAAIVAVLLLAVLAVAGAAGCTGGPGPANPVSVPPSGTGPVRPAGLFVVTSRTLGLIVIDTEGYVLYRYDGDDNQPSRAACVDSCVAGWLPVRAAVNLRIDGIDRQLIGMVDRPDGTAQVTLAGWPLYGYAGDRMPGDTFGHGRDGRWFAVAPDGSRAGRSG